MAYITRFKTVNDKRKRVKYLEDKEEQLSIFQEDVTIDDLVAHQEVVTDYVVKSVDPSTKLTQEISVAGLRDLISSGKVSCPNLYENIGYINADSPYYQKQITEEDYNIFTIPKKSGGYRTIKEPLPELKELLRRHKFFLEDMLRVLPHDSAHAYTRNRSVQTALKVHQHNESKWFLKLDLANFFDNCNPEFVKKQLRNLHPFATWSEEDFNTYMILLNIAFLDNGLPQGTPLSPVLTNLIMTEFDVWMTNYAYKHALRYTRYADDLIISSKYNFDFREVEDEIKNYFTENEYPFNIKEQKTRYGSSNGSNWNLGLMLNKDNDITIGYREHRNLKREMYYYDKNRFNANKYPINICYELHGKFEWLRNVQPEAYDGLMNWFKNKYGYDFIKDLRSRI